MGLGCSGANLQLVASWAQNLCLHLQMRQAVMAFWTLLRHQCPSSALRESVLCQGAEFPAPLSWLWALISPGQLLSPGDWRRRRSQVATV